MIVRFIKTILLPILWKIDTGKFDKMTDDFGNQIDKMVIDKLENRGMNKK